MKVFFCLVATIVVVNAGIIGTHFNEAETISILQHAILLQSESGPERTVRIIYENSAAAPDETIRIIQEELAANEYDAPAPGHSDNDYLLKAAVVAAKHATKEHE